jgi:hypothetical protein
VIDPVSHSVRFTQRLDSGITSLAAVKNASAPLFLVGTEGGVVWILKTYKGGIRSFKVGKLDGVITAISAVQVERNELKFIAGTIFGKLLYQKRKSGRRFESHQFEVASRVSDVQFFGVKNSFAAVAQANGLIDVFSGPDLQLDPHRGASVEGSITRIVLPPVSPDEGQTALVGTEGRVGMWDLEFGLPVEEGRPVPGDGRVVVVAEMPYGTVLIASDGERIRIVPWDMSDSGILLTGHDEPVRDFTILTVINRNYLASSSNDGTVRLWPIESGGELSALRVNPQPLSLSIDDRNHHSVSIVDTRRLLRTVDIARREVILRVAQVDSVAYGAAGMIGAIRKGGHDGGSFLNTLKMSSAQAHRGIVVTDSQDLVAYAYGNVVRLGRYKARPHEEWSEMCRIELEGHVAHVHWGEIGNSLPAALVITMPEGTNVNWEMQVFDIKGRSLLGPRTLGDDVSDATILRSCGHDWVVAAGLENLTLLDVSVDSTIPTLFEVPGSENWTWKVAKDIQRAEYGEALVDYIGTAETKYFMQFLPLL